MTHLDGRLILVVGAPRSGTHWVQRVIAAHPDVVDVPGETHLFHGGLKPLMERFQAASPASRTVGRVYLPRERLLHHLRSLVDETLGGYLEGGREGETRLLERSPGQEDAISLVAELYPQTRFVHVVRDPWASIRSHLQQDFGPSDAVDAARRWRNAVTAARQQGADVEHFHEVRYEQLVDDPLAHTEDLYGFLALEVNDEILERAMSDAKVVANRWSTAERSRQLTRRERAAIRRELGPLAQDEGDPPELTPQTAANDGEHWSWATARQSQRAAEELLEHLHGNGRTPVDELLAPDAVLRIVTGPNAESWHGRGSWPDFLAAVRGDPVMTWPVGSADLHFAKISCVFVNHHREGDQSADRTIAMRLDRTGIVGIDVYRHG